MDGITASQSTEHKDNEVEPKKESEDNRIGGNYDCSGQSSASGSHQIPHEARGSVEDSSKLLTTRSRRTLRQIFSRFISWKVLRLPSQTVIAVPSSGDSQRNLSVKTTKTDVNDQQKPATTIENALKKPYQFWYTQPVPRIDENVASNEPIIPSAWKVKLPEEPYTPPDGFKWDTLNLSEPLVLEELYTFLNENYIEDEESMFRLDYQMDFLKWVLQPPGWRMNLHCGIRMANSGKIAGFISAIPAQLRIYDQVQTAVEINFLCVHKELRGKSIATFLMREIVRRVKFAGIYLAVYTAGVVLPKPIATCRYWLRPINLQKLTDTKFSKPPINMTIQRAINHYILPDSPSTPGFRQLEPGDVKKVVPLLNNYMRKFHLTPIYNEEDFTHWFTPQTDVIDSFVVEAADGSITDFVSYYILTFAVVGNHPVYKTLKAAYAFYNVSTKTSWVDLIQDTLVTAKNSGFDIFYALDLMENKQFFKPLKFRKGYGNLHYYLYNWKCPTMKPNKMALILQ